MSILHESGASLFPQDLEARYPRAMKCYGYFSTYFGNNGLGFPQEGPNYQFFPGKLPVLLSAPHATRQVRNGKLKNSDIMTGSIAEYLSQYAGYHSLTRFYCKEDDPNVDLAGPGMDYKKAAVGYIRKQRVQLFMDLHGWKEEDGYDFCVGINGGKNLGQHPEALDHLIHLLEPLGQIAVDRRFKASLPGNVSRYVAEETGIPCIQLEIGRKFRVEYESLELLLKRFEEETETLL